jgi:hypothetical protein
MKYTLFKVLPSACTLALFAIGCTSTEPFRTSYAPYDASNPSSQKAVIESPPGYNLGFVEFDDQGWFQNPKQLKTVEQMIRTEAGVGLTNNPQGIIILLFVHGWKNNAEYDNTNVVMFRNTLQDLSEFEQFQTNHAARKVVGVYAGWRGLSASLEPFEEMSFWERKNTAHKVGGYGAMTELMVDLENLQQAGNASLASNAPPTELIIVGHSFGGAAVYSALSQIITERFVETIKNKKPLKPLGDQVILLNPAFEASRYFDLNQMALSISQYPTNQRPVLSIFTSEGDWATHYVFPIGRFFSTMFEKTRDKRQKHANWDAVGWFTPYVTHYLIYDTNSIFSVAGNTTFSLNTNNPELKDTDRLRASYNNLQVQRDKWHPNAIVPKTYNFDDCILKPKPNYRPGNPFLVVSVDKKLMYDHNDITNPLIIHFLEQYILFCESDQQAHPK